MTRYLPLLLLSLLLQALPITSLGQSNKKSPVQEYRIDYDNMPDQFSVRVKGVVVDSLSGDPIKGAVITIVAFSDAIDDGRVTVRNLVTKDKGVFEFKHMRSIRGKGHIEISHLGYKMKIVPFNIGNVEHDLGRIQLVESTTDINDVVVSARIEMFRIKGDTTIFYPASVHTMEGDAAIEILRSMPGVEVQEDGHIKVAGQEIERTYVNNELLFGEDPRLAFKYLVPGQIALIEAYEEIDEKSAAEVGSENARRRKVLNVRTKEKITSVTSASAAGSLGADFKKNIDRKNQLRYSIAGEGNLFSTKNQFMLKANLANTPLPATGFGDYYYSIGGVGGVGSGSGYSRAADISISYDRKVNDRHKYGVSYRYSENYNTSQTRSVSDYFPNEEYGYQSRVETDTTSSTVKNSTHTLNLNYTYNRSDSTYINTYGSISLGNASSGYDNVSQTVTDDILVNRLGQRDKNKSDNFTGNVFVNGYKTLGKVTFILDGSFNYNNTDSEGFRIDTGYVDNTRVHIVRKGDTPGISTQVRTGMGYRINDRTQLAAVYSLDYQDNKSEIIAYDKYTYEIDRIDSRNQTLDQITHGAGLDFYYRDDRHSINLSMLANNLRMKKDDRLGDPEPERLSRDFITWNPSLLYHLKMSSRKFVTANISFSQNTPDIDMFSDKLVVSSPVSFQGGNPDLKLSTSTVANIYYRNTKERGSINIHSNTTLNTNNIVANDRYFDSETYLPHYDYTAPAGSTLSTYANGGTSISTTLMGNYVFSGKSRKTTMSFGHSYTFANPQMQLAGDLTRSHRHTGQISTSLRTNFSSKFRADIMESVSLTHSRNPEGINNTLNQSLRAMVEWSIIDYLKLTSQYTLSYLDNSRGSTGSATTHMLNAGLSYKVFKDRNGTFSFTASDILNNRKKFNNYIGLDRIRTTWRQDYSSYFIVSFQYNFNKSK